METHFIRNLDDLGKAAWKSYQHFYYPPIWWRGQPDTREDWKLLPGVYRKPYDEKSLIAKFVRQAKTRHPSCPPDEDNGAWLFLMQHYRLPTRLLDWTEALLVAAYFALDSDLQYKTTSARLWSLSPHIFNMCQLKDGTQSILSLHDTKVKNTAMPLVEDGEIFAVAVPEIDIRMLVQQAACTIHGNKTPIEELPDCDKFLMKYEIPAEAKEELRTTLSFLGVRESSLFPDLEHLAKEISTESF